MTYTKADLLAKVTELMADERRMLNWDEVAALAKPVGLILYGPADGLQAGEFIEQLCQRFGIFYTGKFGRLSQLRKELSNE